MKGNWSTSNVPCTDIFAFRVRRSAHTACQPCRRCRAVSGRLDPWYRYMCCVAGRSSADSRKTGTGKQDCGSVRRSDIRRIQYYKLTAR